MTGMKLCKLTRLTLEVWDKDIPHMGFGQVIKLELGKLTDLCSSWGYRGWRRC